MSLDEWMDKENVVDIYNEILFNLRKQWGLAIWDNTDGLWGIMLSEISQTEKNKYDLTRGILKKQINKFLDTENTLVVARGGHWGGGENEERKLKG